LLTTEEITGQDLNVSKIQNNIDIIKGKKMLSETDLTASSVEEEDLPLGF
jgi:hypothetical protein